MSDDDHNSMRLTCSGADCEATIGLEQAVMLEPDALREACVALATRARDQGWTCVHDEPRQFYCGVCSDFMAIEEFEPEDVPQMVVPPRAWDVHFEDTDMRRIGLRRRLMFGLFAAFIGGAGGTVAAAVSGFELGHGATLFAALGFLGGVLYGAAGLRMARWIA